MPRILGEMLRRLAILVPCDDVEATMERQGTSYDPHRFNIDGALVIFYPSLMGLFLFHRIPA